MLKPDLKACVLVIFQTGTVSAQKQSFVLFTTLNMIYCRYALERISPLLSSMAAVQEGGQVQIVPNGV